MTSEAEGGDGQGVWPVGVGLTAFAPFEVEKTSRLPYVGGRSSASAGSSKGRPFTTTTSTSSRSKAVEITDTLGPPRIFFRKLRTPTPTAETPRSTPPPTAGTSTASSKTATPRVIVVAGASGETGKTSSKRSNSNVRTGAAADKAAPRPVAMSTAIPRGLPSGTDLQVPGSGTQTLRPSDQESQPPPSVVVTKSVLLTRIGTLEKEKVRLYGTTPLFSGHQLMQGIYRIARCPYLRGCLCVETNQLVLYIVESLGGQQPHLCSHC